MAAAFDEMKGPNGGVRPAYGELARWLAEFAPDDRYDALRSG
jgi:hypothetical protein